jgi:quinoprotein glucose dehydrogenase
VLEAAGRRNHPVVAAKLKQYREAQPKDDDLVGFRESLVGGNAANGRHVFFDRVETQCFRCHKIGSEGGGDIGPNLAGLGGRASREDILTAVVHPSKIIAPGYESVTVDLKDGRNITGMLKGETYQELNIFSLESNALVKVRKNDILTRVKGLSGMPEGLAEILSRPDLRDLIEFLATLK